MYSIHIIGAGSLGSTFANEMARRLVALEEPGHSLHIRDFDVVDKNRNVVSQMFSPLDHGAHKSAVVCHQIDRILQGSGCKAYCSTKKVEGYDDIYDPFREGEVLVVDMVDNYRTRLMLDGLPFPVLHAGMSPSGDGLVSWTLGNQSTWTARLSNLSAEQAAHLLSDAADVKLPPCVLSSLRGLIWNTAYAAVEAVTMFLGRDPYGHMQDANGGKVELPGLMTTWTVTPTGFKMDADRVMLMEEINGNKVACKI